MEIALRNRPRAPALWMRRGRYLSGPQTTQSPPGEIVVGVDDLLYGVSPDLHLDLDRKLGEAVERGWSGHGYQKCVANVDDFVWL